MCGIAGVIVWDEKYRVTRETLAKMSAAIAHRGPDGEGIFITRENEPITPDTPQVAFAFRRLAILDCDERAMQPMHTPDGRYTIVFNGEIYNFRELKAELTSLLPDYAWRTTGDTEVLLMSYATWGETCVEKLNGMFAFAVWDHQQKQLFLARDRMGQKPLYTAIEERFTSNVSAASDLTTDVVAFFSEPAASRPLCWIDRKSHPILLGRFLRYGVSQPSLYCSFGTLEPSKCVSIRYSDFGEREYFSRSNLSLPVRGERVGERASAKSAPSDPRAAERKSPLPCPLPAYREREAATDLASTTCRSLVLRAVERQLVSDVPLGVYLSGGVDSSVIAACARKFGPVQSFSIGFDDRRYDESQYAADVAKHIGTTHHAFHVTPHAAADLMQVAAAFGEPFADSSALPTFYLTREARRYVTVALSGDGGDELFGGYDRYRAIELAAKLPRLPLIGRVAGRFAGGPPKSKLTRIARFLKSLGEKPGQRYASYLHLFDPAFVCELIGPQEPALEHDVVADLYERYIQAGLSPAQAATAVDRITYLPNDLLTKVDRCSMAHGLEVRSPFMDHELVQFAAGLTTDQLLKGGPKRMLREAFADDLPAWVFKRKKMGFAVPIGEWFRGPLRSMLRDNLFASDSFAKQHFQMKVVERLVDEHETQRVDHSQRLYALLMLELWWQQQREGSNPNDQTQMMNQ